MRYTYGETLSNPLFTNHVKPCVSIYMTIDHSAFDHKRDMLVFKGLLKKALVSIEQLEDRDILESFHLRLTEVEEDQAFWQQAKKGLALFADQNEMVIYFLEREVEALSIVSSSFHIKPLVDYYQNLETYQLLCLDKDAFSIYEGSLYDIKELTMPSDDNPTLEDVLGKEHTENYQTHGVYGGANDGSTFHGHGGKKDEVDIDQLKYFRFVDAFVLEHISKKKELPLILVSHKAYQSDFKYISKNPFLMDRTIDGSKHDLSIEDLKDALLDIHQERFKKKMDKLLETYHTLIHHERSSDQLIIILKALLEARVDVLWIERHKMIPGKIDHMNHQLIQIELSDPETDDLLDDMVEYGIKTGAKIYVLDQEDMPTSSGVAAMFRY